MSVKTIRYDVQQLEKEGLLKRTHGGVKNQISISSVALLAMVEHEQSKHSAQ